MISASEVAHRLGVSRITVWRMARSGEIPAHRIGKLLRFEAASVELYIKKRAIKKPKK